MNAIGNSRITKFNRLPQHGQVLLYIDFSEVKSKTFSEAYRLLEDMGYQPQLRYTENEDGTITLYALLKDEPFTEEMPREYMADEWERLVEAFLPDDMAVRNPRSLPRLKTA